MRSPSTYSVLTQTGTYLSFSSEYFHSASVIHDPIFALALESIPAHMITEYNPVLFIRAEFPDDPIWAEFPDDPIRAEFPDDPIRA